MSTRLAGKPSKRTTKKKSSSVVEYDMDFSTDTPPKTPNITIEISGPPDSGKTHFCRTFPNPLFLDTEAKAWIVLNKFEPVEWKVVESFNTIRAGVYWAINNDDIDTIVIDSSSEIRQLAENEWLQETGKERVFPTVLWGEVYEKVDALTKDIKESGKHYVVTARLKDEYIGDQRTGRQIVDSYKKYPWDLSMGVRIVYGIRDPRDGKVYHKDRKFGKVIKNNFHGVDPVNMLTFQKPYIFDICYNGVVNEMMEPWHGEDGVPIGNEIDEILKEAEEWILKNA